MEGVTSVVAVVDADPVEAVKATGNAALRASATPWLTRRSSRGGTGVAPYVNLFMEPSIDLLLCVRGVATIARAKVHLGTAFFTITRL